MKRYQTSYSKPFSVRRKERKARRNIIFSAAAVLFLLYAGITWILPGIIGGLTFVTKFKSVPSPTPLINEDATLAPPVLNIPYEATNTGTIKIKGFATAQTKVEIYVDEKLKTTADVHDDGSFLATDVDLSLGTNTIYGKTINDKAASLPSKAIHISYHNEKPKLSLTSPSDNQVVKGGDKKVTVSGSTDAGNEVTANGIRFIVNSDGNFSQTIAINDGDTVITVLSRDSAGNESQQTVKVNYQP